jgi:hypothetical protein
MNTRVTLAVVLSALVLFSGVGHVAGIGSSTSDSDTVGERPVAEANDTVDEYADEAAGERTHEGTIHRDAEPIAQYKVSLDNVTVETWLLRNATVVNATVNEVVIRNATTTNGSRTNVTLTDTKIGEFLLERGRLENVTARKLVVRNKSLLNVPGGEVIDPDVENRTIERQLTRNQTVSGAVINRIYIDAAFLCGNATLGSQAADDSSIDPQAGDEKPDIVVENGTVDEALVIRGEASNWSVGSVERPDATNTSLPDGCNPG